MNKIEKIHQQNNTEKSPYLEGYIMGVYDGNITENDDMFNKILNLLKKRCDENDINYNIDINSYSKIVFDAILEKVKNDSDVNISFNNIENFEDEFIENVNRVNGLPIDKRVITIDSIVNMDFMHNPTTSIIGLLREYIASKLEILNTDINQQFMFNDEEDDFGNKDKFDPFADSSKKQLGDEEKKFYKEELDFFLMLPKFSKVFETRNKYINQISEMRNNFLVDEVKIEYPEYIKQLQDLTNHTDKDISYYYHGAPSQDIAKKILNAGLYMQYNDINRTAKKELSVSEILNYSYGHDNVGRHAVVIIAFPNGESLVNINDNTDITICGTAQGLEQSDFTPKYVIPSQYIVGYIDKDAKQLIANSNYSKDLQNISEKNYS